MECSASRDLRIGDRVLGASAFFAAESTALGSKPDGPHGVFRWQDGAIAVCELPVERTLESFHEQCQTSLQRYGKQADPDRWRPQRSINGLVMRRVAEVQRVFLALLAPDLRHPYLRLRHWRAKFPSDQRKKGRGCLVRLVVVELAARCLWDALIKSP